MKQPPPSIIINGNRVTLLRMTINKNNTYGVNLMDSEIFESQRQNANAQEQALRTLLRRNSIGKEVILGLSYLEYQTYPVTLPSLTTQELLETIKWKIKQIHPFNLEMDQLCYDYLKETTPSVHEKVIQENLLFYFASREVITQKIKLIRSVGLKPLMLVPSVQGLMNLKMLKETSRREVSLWLQVGEESSSLVIEKNDIPLYSKKISLSTTSLIDSIVRTLGLDYSKAKEYFLNYGLGAWAPDKKISDFSSEQEIESKVAYSLASFLENIVVDVEYTFKQFSYQHPEIAHFSHMYITGEGTQLKNINNFLSNRLNVTVDSINISDYVTLHKGITPDAWGLSAFTLNVGLCLEAITSRKKINLMPQAVQSQGSRHMLPGPALPVALCAVVLLVIGMSLNFKINQYKSEIDTMQGQIKNEEKGLISLQSLQLNLAEEEAKILEGKVSLQDKYNFLKNHLYKEKLSSHIALFSSFFSDQVFVTDIRYEESKFSVKGFTFNAQVILDLTEEIRSSKKFLDTTLSYLEKEKNKNMYQFELIIVQKS